MFDVVRLRRGDMAGDLHAQTFCVKFNRRVPIVAFDSAMGERLRDIAPTGKLFSGKRRSPGIRDIIW